jgi:hypothetical protein
MISLLATLQRHPVAGIPQPRPFELQSFEFREKSQGYSRIFHDCSKNPGEVAPDAGTADSKRKVYRR